MKLTTVPPGLRCRFARDSISVPNILPLGLALRHSTAGRYRGRESQMKKRLAGDVDSLAIHSGSPPSGACPLRRVLILLTVPAVLAAQHPAPSAADWAKARRVLTATPLVDSHNDLPWVIREKGKPPMD